MISVLTIVRGRQAHLENLLRGLATAEQPPAELVVVRMNEPTADLPAAPFPVRQYVLRASSPLPLAAARNEAVRRARHEYLVFLDVDCIPAADLLTRYAAALTDPGGLLMGDLRYLPAGAAAPGWTFKTLEAHGAPHPRRPVLKNSVTPTDQYTLFWTLNFALTRATFEQIGRFDEGYVGYGGEDTDFAFAARRAGVPFSLCRAVCYHQHHRVCAPPLQHFTDIVKNASRFRDKWGRWAMEGWLEAFAERGLIGWSPIAAKIKVHRTPTRAEIDAATTA